MAEVVHEQVELLHGFIDLICDQQRVQNVLREHHGPLNDVIEIELRFVLAFASVGWVTSRVSLVCPLADRHLAHAGLVRLDLVLLFWRSKALLRLGLRGGLVWNGRAYVRIQVQQVVVGRLLSQLLRIPPYSAKLHFAVFFFEDLACVSKHGAALAVAMSKELLQTRVR